VLQKYLKDLMFFQNGIPKPWGNIRSIIFVTFLIYVIGNYFM